MNRRTFLSRALGVVAATSTVPTTIALTSIDKTVLSITPEEYLKEMTAAGYRVVASTFRGKPQHVIEYFEESRELAGTIFLDRFGQIQSRVRLSGPDFWKRTSRYLFDRGLYEEVGPRSTWVFTARC